MIEVIGNYTIRIPIGDWSKDGHEICEVFKIESNYPVQKLQKAYKESCKLVGVQFNHSEDYTGKITQINYRNQRLICTEYEDNSLSQFAYEALKSHGVDLENILDSLSNQEEEIYLTANEFINLLLGFIGLSMPSDWKWSFIEDNAPYLNGFWNSDLNVQFGYGLFS